MSTKLKEILTSKEIENLRLFSLDIEKEVDELTIKQLYTLYWNLQHNKTMEYHPIVNSFSVPIACLLILQTRCIEQNKPFL